MIFAGVEKTIIVFWLIVIQAHTQYVFVRQTIIPAYGQIQFPTEDTMIYYLEDNIQWRKGPSYSKVIKTIPSISNFKLSENQYMFYQENDKLINKIPVNYDQDFQVSLKNIKLSALSNAFAGQKFLYIPQEFNNAFIKINTASGQLTRITIDNFTVNCNFKQISQVSNDNQKDFLIVTNLNGVYLIQKQTLKIIDSYQFGKDIYEIMEIYYDTNGQLGVLLKSESSQLFMLTKKNSRTSLQVHNLPLFFSTYRFDKIFLINSHYAKALSINTVYEFDLSNNFGIAYQDRQQKFGTVYGISDNNLYSVQLNYNFREISIFLLTSKHQLTLLSSIQLSEQQYMEFKSLKFCNHDQFLAIQFEKSVTFWQIASNKYVDNLYYFNIIQFNVIQANQYFNLSLVTLTLDQTKINLQVIQLESKNILDSVDTGFIYDSQHPSTYSIQILKPNQNQYKSIILTKKLFDQTLKMDQIQIQSWRFYSNNSIIFINSTAFRGKISNLVTTKSSLIYSDSNFPQTSKGQTLHILSQNLIKIYQIVISPYEVYLDSSQSLFVVRADSFLYVYSSQNIFKGGFMRPQGYKCILLKQSFMCSSQYSLGYLIFSFNTFFITKYYLLQLSYQYQFDEIENGYFVILNQQNRDQFVYFDKVKMVIKQYSYSYQKTEQFNLNFIDKSLYDQFKFGKVQVNGQMVSYFWLIFIKIGKYIDIRISQNLSFNSSFIERVALIQGDQIFKVSANLDKTFFFTIKNQLKQFRIKKVNMNKNTDSFATNKSIHIFDISPSSGMLAISINYMFQFDQINTYFSSNQLITRTQIYKVPTILAISPNEVAFAVKFSTNSSIFLQLTGTQKILQIASQSSRVVSVMFVTDNKILFYDINNKLKVYQFNITQQVFSEVFSETQPILDVQIHYQLKLIFLASINSSITFMLIRNFNFQLVRRFQILSSQTQYLNKIKIVTNLKNLSMPSFRFKTSSNYLHIFDYKQCSSDKIQDMKNQCVCPKWAQNNAKDQCVCQNHKTLIGKSCQCLNGFIIQGKSQNCICPQGNYIPEDKENYCLSCQFPCKSCELNSTKCLQYQLIFIMIIIVVVLIVIAIIICIWRNKRQKSKITLKLLQDQNFQNEDNKYIQSLLESQAS